MTRDEIDNNKDLSGLLEGIPGLDPSLPAPHPRVAAQLIDLNGAPSPAVLSGILGSSVAMVYQYRQDGKLPPNSDASFRDCIIHHINYWKNKAASKASNVAEAALIQEMRLREAKIEREYLALKKDKGDLIDINVLAEVFEPAFLAVRTQLCSLARKHPDLQSEIDKILSGWDKLGQETFKKADAEFTDYIQMMMERELELPEKKKKKEETGEE
jgi:hypothetical protein